MGVVGSPVGLGVGEQLVWWKDAVAVDAGLASDRDVLALLGELQVLVELNPLELFFPHVAQLPFFEAGSPVVAAFAGNRFGKTTCLVVRCLLECLCWGDVPGRLRGFKRWDPDVVGGVRVRLVCPSFSVLDGVLLRELRRWCPRGALLGGSFDKAFLGAPARVLRFANGSSIQFMTYEMDLDKFGGWAGHVVGYDEPPPQDIRDECLFRLADFGGYELFAMTPLKANVGWVRREIFKRRGDPSITVVRGSIHDNPSLDRVTVERVLGEVKSDLWRAAREFGDFVDVGGRVYEEFERCVGVVPPSVDVVGGLDVVVGLDPGIRNCGVVFCGFDGENVLGVFDELLLQDQTPSQWVEAIDGVLGRWGLLRGRVSFVIDPAAGQRSQVSGETVESALARLGVFCVRGENSVEAGVQQLRDRMLNKRFWVSPGCLGLRDEADEYAAEDREDGVFKVVKKNDHRLDALRYVAMYRPFDVVGEAGAPDRLLGFQPGVAPDARVFRPGVQSPPFGFLS